MTRHIDWDKVDQYFICGCNIVQCAAALGIARSTLYERCESDKNQTLQSYFEEKREKGNTAIHAAQFEKAIKDKNPTMLIWLGKQRLHQKDTIDTTPSNDKELSQALINIHSTDVEVMKIKINELQKIVDEYKRKEINNELIPETNSVNTTIYQEI